MFFLFVVASVVPRYLCQGPALYIGEALRQHEHVAGVHPSEQHAEVAGGQTPPYRSPAYVGSFGGQQQQPHHGSGHSPEHHVLPAAYHGSQRPQHVSGDGDDSERGPEPAHDNREGYEPTFDDGKDGPRSSYGASDGDGKDPYGGPNEIGHEDYGYDSPQRSYGSGEENGPRPGAHQSDGGEGPYHGSDDDGDHYGSRQPHHASGYEEHSPRSRGRRRHRNRHSHHETSGHHGYPDHHEPTSHNHGPNRVHGHDSSYHETPNRHHRQPQHRHHHSRGHSEIEGHSLHGGHPHQVHGHHGLRLHRGPNLHYRPSHGHGDMVVGRPVKLTDDSMYGLTLSPLVLSQRPVVFAEGLHHQGYTPQIVDFTQAAPMAHYDLSQTLEGGWIAGASPFINTAHMKS